MADSSAVIGGTTQKQSSVIENGGVYSNDFGATGGQQQSVINSQSTLSGLRKSNPYEYLKHQSTVVPTTNTGLDGKSTNPDQVPRPQLLNQKKQQLMAQNKIQMNIKRQNTVKRTFDYSAALKGNGNGEDFSFDKIDANLKTDYLEGKMREILVEQVMPIVTLSKKNLLYNAQKNQQIEELKEFTQELCQKLDETRTQLANLSTIKGIVKQNHEAHLRSVVTCTTNHEAVTEQLEQFKTIFEEHDGKFREMRQFLTVKDKKVSELTDHVAACRDDLSKCSIRLSKQMAKEFKSRDDSIIYCNRQIRTMDSIISGQRQHLDNLSTQVTRFQIHQELQDQKIEKIVEKDLNKMHNKIEDILKEATRQTTWYCDTNMRFDKAVARLEPLHDRMKVLENFTQRGVPLLTHLQISDALQEFLCLHDQLKLIEYDNKQLEQFSKALLRPDELPQLEDSDAQVDKDSSEDEDYEDPSAVHMDEKKKHEENLAAETENAAQEIAQNEMLHTRLQALMALMTEQKQGCIRFKWGRDWNVRDFDSVQKAASLGSVPYKMYLSNKTSLLKGMLAKDTQQDRMDRFFMEAQRKRMSEENHQQQLNSHESHRSSMTPITNRTQMQDVNAFRDESRLSLPSEKVLDDQKSEQQFAHHSRDHTWKNGSKLTNNCPSEEIASSGEKDTSSMSQTQNNISMINYYTPKFDCGFQGGQPMMTPMGPVGNAHVNGSGIGKVFREVTIIRTGNGAENAAKRGNQLARRQTMLGNRRKLKLLEQKKQYVSRAAKESAATIVEYTGESSGEEQKKEQSINDLKKMQVRQSHYSMDEAAMPDGGANLTITDCEAGQNNLTTLQVNQESSDHQVAASVDGIKIGSQEIQSSNDTASQKTISEINNKIKESNASLKTSKSISMVTDGRSSKRRRGPPMIPSEELQNLRDLIKVNRQGFETFLKEYEQYKNAVQSDKADLGLKLKSIDKEIKKAHDQQTKIGNKFEMHKLQLEEVEKDLSEKITQAEQFSSRNIKDMRRIFEEVTNDNKQFKKYIVGEYVEFFKSKKKIRQEQAMQAAETEKKINEFLGMLRRYDHNITTLNTCLPILVEVSNLVCKFSHADISARSVLSESLKLQTLPNSGYLRVDKTNIGQNSRLPSAKSPRGASAQKRRIILNAEKPVSEQFVQGGSLCTSKIQYRNTTLTTGEYLGVVQDLVELCQKRFSAVKVIRTPKKYFDDAVINLRNGTSLAKHDDITIMTPFGLEEPSSHQNSYEMLLYPATQPTFDQPELNSDLHLKDQETPTSRARLDQSNCTTNQQTISSPDKRSVRPRTTDKTMLGQTQKKMRMIQDIRNESAERLKKSMAQTKPVAIYQKSKKQLLELKNSKGNVVKGNVLSRNSKIDSQGQVHLMYSTADAFKKPPAQQHIVVGKVDSYRNMADQQHQTKRTRNQVLDEAYMSYQTSSEFSRESIRSYTQNFDNITAQKRDEAIHDLGPLDLNISGQKLAALEVRASTASRNLRQQQLSSTSSVSKKSLRKSYVSKDSQVKINKIDNGVSNSKTKIPMITKETPEKDNTMKSLNSDILSVQLNDNELQSPDFKMRLNSQESNEKMRESRADSTALLSKRPSGSVSSSINKPESVMMTMQVNKFQ